MEMEQRGEQSISLSMSRIAEMATSAVTKREKVVKSSETERKERMDTSSLMEQILSSDNLNRAYLQVVRNKGAEGVDGMKYTELKEFLAKNGEIRNKSCLSKIRRRKLFLQILHYKGKRRINYEANKNTKSIFTWKRVSNVWTKSISSDDRRRRKPVA